MKLEENYLRIACRDAMIMQYTEVLSSDGYSVKREENLVAGSSNFTADLYAVKNDEKRIYEFKVIGSQSCQERNVLNLKEFADLYGAIPFIIYVNPPVTKNIEIDDLDVKIRSEITGDGIPEELDCLSTHTDIDDVQIDELTNIKISNGSITVDGEAIISVNLIYGSESDEQVSTPADFPMSFTIELDFELSITDYQYEIDTSSFYE